MLPLQASGENRGLPLPPMLQLLVILQLVLRYHGVSGSHWGPLQHVPADCVPHGRAREAADRKAHVQETRAFPRQFSIKRGDARILRDG